MKIKKTIGPAVKSICFGAFILTASLFASCQKDALNGNTSSEAVPTNIKLTSLAATQTSQYKLTAPIVLNGVSNITISGDSINGGSSVGITLINCKNIHITKSKIMNGTQRGIFVSSCTNVLIDSCFISNVAIGIYAHDSFQVRVMSNQLLDMKGPVGSFIQFDNITGGYNRICYNKCEDVIVNGSNPNAGDGISLYKSNGSPTDQIMVLGNSIRGGCTNTGASGMAGIVAGDVGGSYQDIENNILVNTGYVGIQMQGGTNITIKNNQIYSDRLPWSGLGLCSANYSGLPSNNNTITGNKVKWNSGYALCGCNFERDTVYKAGSGSSTNAVPTGWASNTVNAPLTSSILPTVLITQK